MQPYLRVMCREWGIRAIAYFRRFSVFACMVTVMVVWLSNTPSALADPTDQPATCRLGSYITSLHDLNPAQRSFGAEFWVWSVCPSQELQPLQSMEVVNASNVAITHPSELKREDLINSFPEQDEVYWSQQKVKATLQHVWNVQNYPFDRHTLEIPIEESTYDTTALVYTPDTTNSTYKEDLHLEGWKITDFQVKQGEATYKSTFGDPELLSGESSYTRLSLLVSIERQSALGFFKVVAGVYAAFLICLLSFFLDVTDIPSRIGLLSGALFATLVNMRGVDTVLGATEQVTLLDKIHVLTLGYIVTAGLVTIVLRMLSESRNEKALKLFNRRLGIVFSISFVVTNVILIANAINVG